MKRLCVCILAMCSASCAEWNSIHRSTTLFDSESVSAQSISIDAKQRFLLAGQVYGEPIFCSEPSPDVFSVFSAALEANASNGEELAAAFKLATNETGATIGIRTQSIQLLRDAMYRICEAYLGGGIDRDQYNDLLKRYQKSMVTLIAIEQLTGAARPGQIVIGAGSTVNASSAVYETKQALNKARDDHDKAAAAKKSAEDKVTSAESDLGGTFADKCEGQGKPAETDKDKCEAVTKAKSDDAKAGETLKKAKSEMDEWQQVFNKVENATSLAATGEGQVIPAVGTQLDTSTVATLASSVRALVQDVFMDDFIKACLDDTREAAQSTSRIGMEQPLERLSMVIEDTRDRRDELADRIQSLESNLAETKGE
jgi:hypothetical protein